MKAGSEKNLASAAPRAEAGQRLGSLPAGSNHDSLLTIAEFCAWQRRSRKWFCAHRFHIPGLHDNRIHVGAYLRGVFPSQAKHF